MTTRLLTHRDVMAMTALSRSAVYALMAESQFPEADPGRQPRCPLGRAGGARLHRQPSPSRLGSPRRVAAAGPRSTRPAARGTGGVEGQRETCGPG